MNVSAQFLSLPPTGPEADGVCLVEGALILKGQSSTSRQPVHMVFVVDISDSMSESRKLDTVKQSLQFIAPLLTQEDMVSLITFGNEAEILLKQVPASEQTPILGKIQSLRTNGYTNMSGGLMCITDCLADLNRPNMKTGILLLTDGHANKGVSDTPGLKSIVRRLVELHPSLTLTTIGYGHDHQVDLLRDMAEVGGGSYNIVYTLESVATTFGEVLGGLTTVVAQNVEVRVPAAVQLKTGYSIRRNAANEQIVRVGDVYADNEILILFAAEQGTTLRVTGHDMTTLSALDIALQPTVPATDTQEIPKSVQIAMFRYEVSELLRQSVRSHTATSPLTQTAEDLLTRLRTLPYASEQLIQMMIDDIEQLLVSMDAGPMPERITTNLVQHSAYLAMGRGLRSQMPAEESFDQDILRGAMSTPPRNRSMRSLSPPALTTAPSLRHARTANVDTTFSPFSNPNQRRTTQALRTMSQT
jgi:hypothetical protein